MPPLRLGGADERQFAFLTHAITTKAHDDPTLGRTLRDIALKAVSSPDVPRSYWDAMKSPDAEGWLKAMDEEIKNCEDHGTGERSSPQWMSESCLPFGSTLAKGQARAKRSKRKLD